MRRAGRTTGTSSAATGRSPGLSGAYGSSWHASNRLGSAQSAVRVSSPRSRRNSSASSSVSRAPVGGEPAFEGPALEEVGHTRRVRGHPTAAIVTIGNEVVSGDIENTNASWLARRLERLGVVVRLVAAVPDEVDAIAAARAPRGGEADLVIVTGGLGGTPDDVTREAIASAFDVRAAGARGDRRPASGPASRAPRSMPPAGRSCRRERGRSRSSAAARPGSCSRTSTSCPGLPGEMKPMFESLEDEFRRERPIGSWRRTFETRESEIAPLLVEARARYPDVRVGSYPTFTPEGPLVEVVVKSADPSSAGRGRGLAGRRDRAAHELNVRRRSMSAGSTISPSRPT